MADQNIGENKVREGINLWSDPFVVLIMRGVECCLNFCVRRGFDILLTVQNIFCCPHWRSRMS